MSERSPYSRLYWSVMDDPKFDGIREDMRHFGAWSMLLIVADMAWPAPAFPPPTVSRRSFQVLVAAELVDPLSGGRFRIHGLDAERGRRSEAARVGGLASGRSRSVDQTVNERGTETNLAETKPSRVLDETETSRDTARDPADLYWQLTGKYPKDNTLSWLDQLTATYGSDATSRELAAAFGDNPAVATLIGRTQDRLRADARQLDRSEKATEVAALEEKRSKPVVAEEWREQFREVVAAKEMDIRKRTPLPGDAA